MYRNIWFSGQYHAKALKISQIIENIHCNLKCVVYVYIFLFFVSSFICDAFACLLAHAFKESIWAAKFRNWQSGAEVLVECGINLFLLKLVVS